jgi:hypothetical protein
MIRSAVAEDKALQGCNLSAVDGPGLVGVLNAPHRFHG